MTPLLRPVTKTKCSIPAALASSTTCWMTGRSTTVSISLGTALVAGRKRVPSPATGNTAFRIRFFCDIGAPKKGEGWEGARERMAGVGDVLVVNVYKCLMFQIRPGTFSQAKL